QDQEIDVEVTIDGRGKVTAARLVKTSGLAASLIMGSALSTAQAMRFEPATLNGRPIESQHVIRFVLSGKSQ
ncbi:MAG TPA: energy transducer TonB, partial [Bryobacteraceae bacterium]|nr:energy transducer TonB [Bryobacteraceae bacterium]